MENSMREIPIEIGIVLEKEFKKEQASKNIVRAKLETSEKIKTNSENNSSFSLPTENYVEEKSVVIPVEESEEKSINIPVVEEEIEQIKEKTEPSEDVYEKTKNYFTYDHFEFEMDKLEKQKLYDSKIALIPFEKAKEINNTYNEYLQKNNNLDEGFNKEEVNELIEKVSKENKPLTFEEIMQKLEEVVNQNAEVMVKLKNYETEVIKLRTANDKLTLENQEIKKDNDILNRSVSELQSEKQNSDREIQNMKSTNEKMQSKYEEKLQAEINAKNSAEEQIKNHYEKELEKKLQYLNAIVERANAVTEQNKVK